MGLGSGLFAGVTGLNANGSALSVIGNNIANVNTVGFKKADVVFSDILSATGDAAGSIGRGVLVSNISTDFSQGSFKNTSNVLDLGVDGSGFFVVNSTEGSFYSRAGKFEIDQEGYVVTASDKRLQGYPADANGNLQGGYADINVSSAQSSPLPTGEITISVTLDSAEDAPAAFDVADAAATSNFSTSITVYDSLGASHPVTVYFRMDGPAAPGSGNTWEWFAVVEASENLTGIDEIQAQGTLDFSTSGALDTESAITYPLASGGFDFTGGAQDGQVIDFEFGTSVAEGGDGLGETTQFGTTSNVKYQDQDGFSSGALQSLSIDQTGTIAGLFTNGQTRILSQVVLAKFNSPTGLIKLGDSLYAESVTSGQPIVGAPDTAGRGRVLSNSIELSNVDLAEEFVNMIMSQRGFQANSRVITTTDEMLAELVNLKR